MWIPISFANNLTNDIQQLMALEKLKIVILLKFPPKRTCSTSEESLRHNSINPRWLKEEFGGGGIKTTTGEKPADIQESV